MARSIQGLLVVATCISFLSIGSEQQGEAPSLVASATRYALSGSALGDFERHVAETPDGLVLAAYLYKAPYRDGFISVLVHQNRRVRTAKWIFTFDSVRTLRDKPASRSEYTRVSNVAANITRTEHARPLSILDGDVHVTVIVRSRGKAVRRDYAGDCPAKLAEVLLDLGVPSEALTNDRNDLHRPDVEYHQPSPN